MMDNNKYETCLCPICSTPHTVDDSSKDIICLCGARFYIVTDGDGNKDLMLRRTNASITRRFLF